MTTPQIFFDPGQLGVRWQWETFPGSGVPAGPWRDVQVKGEKMSFNSEFVERTAIERNAMDLAPLPGKMPPGGELEIDAFSPRADWWLPALLVGAVDTPGAALETGAYLHKVHRLGATSFPASTVLRVDRNDGLPVRYQQTLAGSFMLKFAEKQLVASTFNLVPAKGDYWGDPIASEGNTGTATPALRGINALNFEGTDYWVKITAVTSSTVSVEAHRGAASYGAAVVFQRGQWQTALAETGNSIQVNRGNPVDLYFPLPQTGPTVDFAVGDEFDFPYHETSWTPTYNPAIVVNEIYSAVIVNGTEYEIDSGELTIAKGAEGKGGIGNRQHKRTRTRGTQKVSGKFTHEYQALNFKQQLELAETFGVVIDLRTGVPIGTSGTLDYGIKITMNNCTLKGKGASAEDQKKMDESVEFQAGYNPSDETYPSDVTFEILNNVPDLTDVTFAP